MSASTEENSGCLSVFLPFLKRGRQNTSATQVDTTSIINVPESLPYRLRDDFLSPGELSFYKILSGLVGNGLSIQSKVRLADIFFVSRPNENKSYFGKISQKHLDFLICDAKAMSPIFGIELDDSSHQKDHRQKRDMFVESVFAAADLPLLRIPLQHSYNTAEVADSIRPILLHYLRETKLAEPVVQSEPDHSTAPICPKCGIPMLIRTVTKGDHKGKQFYGCSNYPRCREMKPYQ